MSIVGDSSNVEPRERLEKELHELEVDRNANLPLILCIVASLAIHGFLLVPRLSEMLSEGHDGVDRTRAASFSVEKEMEKRVPPAPEDEDNSVKLGIEDGTTKSTMTWIGYNEYQEHLAKLSQVDQAAFRDTDEGGQPMPAAQPSQAATVPQVPQPEAAAPPAPSVNQSSPGEQSPAQQRPATPAMAKPPQQQTPPEQKPPEQTQPDAKPTPPPPPSPTSKQDSPPTQQPPAPPPVSAATEETKPAKDAIPIPSADTNKIEPQIQPVEKVIEAKESKDSKDAPPPPKSEEPRDVAPAPPTQIKPEEEKQTDPNAKPPPPPQDPQQQPPKPQDAQQQPAAQPPASAPPTQAATGQQQPSTSPTTGQAPDPSAQPGAKPGPKATGELSDKESDATSVTAAPTKDWKSGKPLAAKGIEVRTKRPYFDELTSISTAPGSPLALIEFNREGKAVTAKLLESSGYDTVDQAILDSLYGWTVNVAKSPQLNKLKPGETLKFKIRLLLR